MFLIFDTETTGLPKDYNAPVSDSNNWPRAIQIAWQLHNKHGQLIEHQDFLIKPDDFDIPYDAEKIHGISTELAQQNGLPITLVMQKFQQAIDKASYIVGQNILFDINIMGAEFYRYNIKSNLSNLPILDTCTEVTANLCKIPGGRAGRFKLPQLTELHQFLFGVPFDEAHNATADVEATARCFFELIRLGEGFLPSEITPEFIVDFQKNNPSTINPIGLKHINLKEASEQIRKKQNKKQEVLQVSKELLDKLENASFAHLHNHSQFTILQATSSVSNLIKNAIKHKMPAVALTDTGNMMGAFLFVQEITKYNKSVLEQHKESIVKNEKSKNSLLKPIVGCEFNICENHLDRTKKDNGYQVVFLAKNKNGYHNLCKMASIAYTQGYYYVARIDKNIVKKYKDDLIVLSGNLSGEIPSKILNIGEKQAEEALIWWKSLFKDDFYLEIMRHGQEDENRANQILQKFAQIHDVKLVATNNTYYIEQKDANAHDILLCLKEGEKKSTPIGRGRGFRYGFNNQEYYFKSSQQMKELFQDLPQAILSIQEIIDKIEYYDLARNVLLPKFNIPTEFVVANDPDGKKGENNYLRHLTYIGAKKKYKEITKTIEERLDFELEIIAKTGYPGYFLIVQDFIAAAREMNVSVGPGRGSAAGSAVAYCLNITNIDPIKYDLLFERFLNPDRISLPDIDIDFDNEGRSRVMEYVINKYGANQVAQIITYGTMAAKSSIRDTARVLDLPLDEADKIAKLVPDIKLSKLFSLSDQELSDKLKKKEDIDRANELKRISESDNLAGDTIQQARLLEGSLRNTGIHACGVIITPDDITNFVPVALAKDSDMWVTQFDNSVVESAGLLKMDFLGLSTLTLIKDTIKLIKHTKGIDINPDEIPIDDLKTYELFQRGETVGIFQYESAGMQKYMRELKPTVFADLIAMNALYRPGPIEYIPQFINRKHGLEAITYDLPEMEEYLKETYGITVYQEQVMLLSQKLAGFTKGDADNLRKAMGKKLKDVLAKMKPKFIEQAVERGHPSEILEKIWKDWEAFASYAFNKSHSTCYAWIAYQTAYLKANYPSEYMAAVLSNNMDQIKDIRFFLEECKRMGISVLVPDVNESNYKFTVTSNGSIRFGLGAIKGIGKGAVDSIIKERENGPYSSIFDLAKRIDFRSVNKKSFELIAQAGGFDSFGGHRAQFFYTEDAGKTNFITKIINYGTKVQQNSNSAQLSLFGDSNEILIPEPPIPNCIEWSLIEKLKKEKEIIGLFISGHPLDDFKSEINHFCNSNELNGLSLKKENFNALAGKEFHLIGIISDYQERTSRDNLPYGIFTLEDYDNSYEFFLYKDDFLKFRMYMIINNFIYIKVKIQPGYINRNTQKESPARLQLLEIAPVYSLFEDKTKRLTLNISIQELTFEKVKTLKNIVSNHIGNKELNFRLFSPSTQNNNINHSLEIASKTTKIDINKNIIEQLTQENFQFTLT